MQRYLKRLIQPLKFGRTTTKRPYAEMHDPLEHATGIEKRELLAMLAGNCDPFNMMPIKRGPGTCEKPNIVPSAFSQRMIACHCNLECNHLEYMWLHQGEPKRCGCGFWFLLCPVAPL